MRTPQQSGNGRTGDSRQAPPSARTARPPAPTAAAHPLLGVQNSAGNRATTRALRRNRAGLPRPALAGVDEGQETGLELPSYLMHLQAAGLSTACGLTGHEFVRHAVAAVVGRGDGDVGDIAAELAGRPESFFGQGRAFAVQGRGGKEWFDVTVAVRRAPDDRPPVFQPPEHVSGAAPGPDAAPQAELEDAEGKDTKVDVQHNSGATVSSTAGSSSSKGVGGMGFGLAPVVPGLFLGGAATGNVQPWQSSRESRRQKNVAEPRVLRSDMGSVEVTRKVLYDVRVQQHGSADAQSFQGAGTLTQRVPTEHLVPGGTGDPVPPRPLHADPVRAAALADSVSQADSLAPVAVVGTGAPQRGGGGLFDAVASVLHPSITASGAPGRARLQEATATATVLEDMPRLLRDGVVGEDLRSRDGKTAGSYQLRAVLTGLSPAWGTGKTQLRTHQQGQDTVAESAGKGRAISGGAGPAIGVGLSGSAAVVRATAMPVGGARKARFTTTEQTVSSRQGAEVRGEKALYFGTVTISAEGTGPRSAEMVLHPERRVATHSMKVWMSLRADEAQALGLPLPPGMAAGEFVEKPKRTDDNGDEVDVERHLAYGGKGSNVALSQIDTGPMVRAVREMFATDPRLAGYLPAFGTSPPGAHVSREEAEVQRRNHRELMTALSETNLRVNKDQLLSTGLTVRLRRKTTMHAHDVHLRVKGDLGDTTYQGDIKDWLVRAHSGVTSNSQSGRSSSRSIGGLVLGQARLVPGVLTGAARYERHSTGNRRNQAGPTGRSDIVANGSESASAFAAPLRLDVDVTMTSRPRKLARTVTPGSPGQDGPASRPLGGLHLPEQDVRLLTPTEFTLDQEGKERLDAVVEARKAQASRPDYGFAAEGIGDLASVTPRPSAGRVLRDWQLVESLDGEPVRALAYELLARAAARDKGLRRDTALESEGLAPRQALEERFGERSIQGALRQAASSGWVVKNLRYPRRLAALNGAVGTRIALANPKFLHTGSGPGTETFVLGGHQSAGQVGQGTTNTVQIGATVTGNAPEWRTGQGLSGYRTWGEGDTQAAAVSGTVERNTHTPKKAPLYLVQCDVLVNMVAEVKVTGGGPYVTKGARTLPAAAGVWLTEAQLPPRIRRQLGLDSEPPNTKTATATTASSGVQGESPAESSRMAQERADREPAVEEPKVGEPAGKGQEARDQKVGDPAAKDAGGSSGVSGSAPTRATGPTLGVDSALGFGTIEDLPDFVPLLARLRASLAAAGQQGVADAVLPRQQTKDRNDNVQRLLRVLDRDGSAGLLSSAMDGGVTVELLDGRRTPYWAVFKITRSGPGTYEGDVDDGRDMEYITSAVSQSAGSHDEGAMTGVEGIVAGSGKPEGGLGQLKSTGGSVGLGYASGDSRRTGTAGRGQLGMKTVAEASAAQSAKMRVPIRASLELYKGDRRLGLAQLGDKKMSLTQRVLKNDLAALNRVVAPVAQRQPAAGRAPAGLGAWRAGGVRLPMEAQVNGFQGVTQVRRLLDSAVRQAGGGDRFRDRGQAAAYALNEAVSTEWMIAALPLLTSAGAELPPVHASGAEGQDLRASLHARLRQGRVLGVGDKMTFETVGQSHLEAPRPTQTDGQSSTDKSRAARPMGGAGLLNADEFRLNQLMGNTGGSGGAADATANSAGSMPLHKPKMKSVLVQFTLDVRVVAQLTNRVRTGRTETVERETTLARPVVIRMPEPMVRRMLLAEGAGLQDPDNLLGLGATVAPPPPPPSGN
ncbi:hypothetical protein [Streptomyces pseudovenezuelae]|uniref:hypothetical protein n=1 Tax=Streptomyces pseudovenezuelae TaxID=67350 RepID=UPI002475D5B0|nr:hypothetical protein [Streptomyces pseudovenezuelae]